MSTSAGGQGFGVLGIGAAACVACCAGPIVAFLGGLGIAGLLSTLVVGVAGLAVAAGAVIGLVAVRRKSRHCDPAPEGPVPVEMTARGAGASR